MFLLRLCFFWNRVWLNVVGEGVFMCSWFSIFEMRMCLLGMGVVVVVVGVVVELMSMSVMIVVVN